MSLRPFCRETTTCNDITYTCHLMKGHAGPHISRRDEVGQDRGETRWYSTIRCTGPESVA